MKKTWGAGILGFALILLFCSAAAAQDVADAHMDKRLHTGWSMGAGGSYMFVPDSGLDYTYRRHTSINASTAEIFVSYGYPHIDIIGSFDYWFINVGNGIWFKKGDNPNDKTYYQKEDLGLMSADLTIMYKVPINRVLTYRIGAGAGMGYMYGRATSQNVVDGKIQKKTDHPHIPPVIPIFRAQTGFQIFFIKQLCLNLDAGIHEGVFFSGGLQVFFQ